MKLDQANNIRHLSIHVVSCGHFLESCGHSCGITWSARHVMSLQESVACGAPWIVKALIAVLRLAVRPCRITSQRRPITERLSFLSGKSTPKKVIKSQFGLRGWVLIRGQISVKVKGHNKKVKHSPDGHERPKLIHSKTACGAARVPNLTLMYDCAGHKGPMYS